MNGRQQVETQLREVREFFSVEGLRGEVCGHQTDPPETSCGASDTGKFRQFETMRIAENDPLDPASTVDEKPDPAIEFLGQLDQISRECNAYDLVRWNGARREALQ